MCECQTTEQTPGTDTILGLDRSESVAGDEETTYPDAVMNTMATGIENLSDMLKAREWAGASPYRLDDLAEALNLLERVMSDATAAAAKLSDLAWN